MIRIGKLIRNVPRGIDLLLLTLSHRKRVGFSLVLLCKNRFGSQSELAKSKKSNVREKSKSFRLTALHFISLPVLLLALSALHSMAPRFELTSFSQMQNTNTTHDDSTHTNDTDDAINAAYVYASIILCIWSLTQPYFELIVNPSDNEGPWTIHFHLGFGSTVYPTVIQHDAEYEREEVFFTDEDLMALLPQ